MKRNIILSFVFLLGLSFSVFGQSDAKDQSVESLVQEYNNIFTDLDRPDLKLTATQISKIKSEGINVVSRSSFANATTHSVLTPEQVKAIRVFEKRKAKIKK